MKRRILPDFENETIPAYNFDVIIVGTGVAGLYAALNLDEDLEVAVVTKANIDESNSYLAQGGIAAVMTADDNYHNHVEDTLVAGAGLCNREAVEVLCEEGPSDIHKLIENAVYLHLLHNRFEVFTGQQSGGREIDFVARRADSVLYVQATYQLLEEATRQREFGNLLAIPNNYPKYVVSLDEWTSGSNINGIYHLHLAEFLQMKL